MKNLIQNKYVSALFGTIKGTTGTNDVTGTLNVVNSKSSGNTIIIEESNPNGIDNVLTFLKNNELFPYTVILKNSNFTPCMNNTSNLTFRGNFKNFGTMDISGLIQVNLENFTANNNLTLTNSGSLYLKDCIFKELTVQDSFEFEIEDMTVDKLKFIGCSGIEINGLNIKENSIIELENSTVSIDGLNVEALDKKIKIKLTNSELMLSSNNQLLPNNIITNSTVHFKNLKVTDMNAELFNMNNSTFNSLNTTITNCSNLFNIANNKSITINGTINNSTNLFSIESSDNTYIETKIINSNNLFNINKSTNTILILNADENSSPLGTLDTNIDFLIKDSIFNKEIIFAISNSIKVKLINLNIKDNSLFNIDNCVDFSVKNIKVL